MNAILLRCRNGNENKPAQPRYTVRVYDGDDLIAEIFTDYITLVGAIRLYRAAKLSFHIPTYLSDVSENGSGIGDKAPTLSTATMRLSILRPYIIR